MAFYTNTQIDTNFLTVNELPIQFSEYRRGIHAYVRAIPNNLDAPVVIHLVDWEVVVEDFEIILNEELFFAKLQAHYFLY